MRRLCRHPVVFLLLTSASVLALYGNSLRLWWCCDDPAILLHAQRYAPLAYFTVPSAWRALVPYSLTPWLSLVYDFDLALFGFWPAAFFAHQLLSLSLCAWLLQRIAARWAGDGAATLAALLFLLGTPVALAAQMLMVRQYVEGLLFFLLALWLLLRRLDGGPVLLQWLAALAFAVAVSAKEVLVPLGLLPLLLPLADWRQRLRAVWPWLLVLALYLPWRWYMLGELVGGYTPAGELAGSSSVAELARAFAEVPALLWRWPLLAGAGWLVLLAVALVRRPPLPTLSLAWLLLLALALLAPLLPLVRFPGLSERYFIVPWAALALLAALVLGRAWPGRPLGLRLLLLAALAALMLPAWLLAQPLTARAVAAQNVFRLLGQAYLQNDAPVRIWAEPAVPPWFTQGLVDLRPALGLHAPPPQALADESALPDTNTGGVPILRFDVASQTLHDISADWPALARAWRERLDAGSLSLTIEHDVARRVLRWRLEPAAAGRFSLLSVGGVQSVPAHGQLRMEQLPDGCFRIRLERANGRLSYSPLLAWPVLRQPDGVARLSWQGSGDLFTASLTPLCLNSQPS